MIGRRVQTHQGIRLHIIDILYRILNNQVGRMGKRKSTIEVKSYTVLEEEVLEDDLEDVHSRM